MIATPRVKSRRYQFGRLDDGVDAIVHRAAARVRQRAVVAMQLAHRRSVAERRGEADWRLGRGLEQSSCRLRRRTSRASASRVVLRSRRAPQPGGADQLTRRPSSFACSPSPIDERSRAGTRDARARRAWPRPASSASSRASCERSRSRPRSDRERRAADPFVVGKVDDVDVREGKARAVLDAELLEGEIARRRRKSRCMSISARSPATAGQRPCEHERAG